MLRGVAGAVVPGRSAGSSGNCEAGSDYRQTSPALAGRQALRTPAGQAIAALMDRPTGMRQLTCGSETYVSSACSSRQEQAPGGTSWRGPNACSMTKL